MPKKFFIVMKATTSSESKVKYNPNSDEKLFCNFQGVKV